MDGPVNTLAQLWLWRLETQVLAAVIVASIGAVYAVADLVAGPDAAQWVIDVAGTALLLAPPVLVVLAIIRFLSPAAQFRALDKKLTAYNARFEN
jgi:hypothetical protein